MGLLASHVAITVSLWVFQINLTTVRWARISKSIIKIRFLWMICCVNAIACHWACVPAIITAGVTIVRAWLHKPHHALGKPPTILSKVNQGLLHCHKSLPSVLDKEGLSWRKTDTGLLLARIEFREINPIQWCRIWAISAAITLCNFWAPAVKSGKRRSYLLQCAMHKEPGRVHLMVLCNHPEISNIPKFETWFAKCPILSERLCHMM